MPKNRPKTVTPKLFLNDSIFFHVFLSLLSFYRFAQKLFATPTNRQKLPRPHIWKMFWFFFVLWCVLPIYIGIQKHFSFRHLQNAHNGHAPNFKQFLNFIYQHLSISQKMISCSHFHYLSYYIFPDIW